MFEAEALPVRDTILDAVTAVLDRADRRNIRILTEPFEDRLLWHTGNGPQRCWSTCWKTR